MNHETTRTLAIIHELTRHGWTRDKEPHGSSAAYRFAWRDPLNPQTLYDIWDARNIQRNRTEESEITNG